MVDRKLSGRRTSIRPIVLVVVISCQWCSAMREWSEHRISKEVPKTQHGRNRSQAGCSSGMLFRFESYSASAFEKDWQASITKSDEDGCNFIRTNPRRVKTWLSSIQEFNSFEYSMASPFNENTPHRKEEAITTLSEDVFSKMTFTNVCPGEFAGVKKEIFLEPVVGHFRHPLALKQCQPADEKAKDIHIMDLSYILLNPWPAADISLVFPGKRYLFDLGTSAFQSSLQYLTTRYRQAGIEFDSIWAWEVAGTDPVNYWRNVPESYHSRLHFYNTPITDNFNHGAHPLNILRSIFQQGDFVVVKLDIDNGPLETAIIKEIESDTELRSSIAEMMYEQHYDHRDMSPWFGLGNGASLADVSNTFSTLRESGLLLHYWP